MNKHGIGALAAAIALAFSAGAMAQGMSKDEYRAQEDVIAGQYKAAKSACEPFAANAKDICMAEAKGKEKVAMAELEGRYKPSEKNRYKARVARAEAVYSVAREKCDDKAGNTKDVCVKEAKAVRTAAKANARAHMKTADANEVAGQVSAEARGKADLKSDEAQKVADTAKRDAEYDVAHEKCGALAGDTKDRCITEAKARFGKS